jgi:hypothetical protein
MPEAVKRVEAVRKFRAASKSIPTQKIAKTPTRFHVEKMPTREFLLIPKVSSERRLYIPIGFMSPETLVSDLVFVVEEATLFHFGILSSAMHMAWVRQIAGRLESRYRYSGTLVYNNFPWPDTATKKARETVEAKAQLVLDARQAWPDSSLADLYDPVTMPRNLSKAHAELDKVVDKCYRSQPFANDLQRMEFLFRLYDTMTAPITAGLPKARRRKQSDTSPPE